MRNKLTILTSGFLMLMVFLGLYTIPISPLSKTVELEIVKIDGVWRVVDVTNQKKIVVKVKKKDTIVWTVTGTDATFQFPEGLFDPASDADNLPDGYTKFIADGHKLKLIIRDDAPTGTYQYAVFCNADGVFARGDSPPVIIIE